MISYILDQQQQHLQNHDKVHQKHHHQQEQHPEQTRHHQHGQTGFSFDIPNQQ